MLLQYEYVETPGKGSQIVEIRPGIKYFGALCSYGLCSYGPIEFNDPYFTDDKYLNTVMACIAMAYVVMAYIAMAHSSLTTPTSPMTSTSIHSWLI